MNHFIKAPFIGFCCAAARGVRVLVLLLGREHLVINTWLSAANSGRMNRPLALLKSASKDVGSVSVGEKNTRLSGMRIKLSAPIAWAMLA